MRTNFGFLRLGAAGVLAAALTGCYVATPYGYAPYGAPVYTAYPAPRYQAYPVPYGQPVATYPRVVQQPAPSAPVAEIAGSVYFDVNSAIIKPEYQNVVQAQASYLLAHPGTRVMLQGNADDRGTSGYNQSLGTQRADAVRLALMSCGVPASQISTVSLGDKSPADPSRGEAAYAKNRRVDFRYQ